MASTDNPTKNYALEPIAAAERVFHWHTHASLWFSLGVGLLVMQVGAYLVPSAGTRDAALAIVLGSLVGAGLLAWVAKIGCDSGLTSAALMHRNFGSAFARLPVVLNIAQLIGWTTFELVIMRDGTAAIAAQSFGLAPDSFAATTIPTLLWGLVLVLLLAGSMTTLVRQTISRYALPLVIASLVWLSWQFGTQLGAKDLSAFWARAGDGTMGLPAAMDLVVAMPVSWLPLVADYARHGKSGKGAFGGTFFGYLIANVWCYALGVVVANLSAPDVDLVNALLLAQGGLIALSLILVDEIDNAYGDVYSSAVSAHSMRPMVSIRQWGMGIAALCTLLALVLPMRSIEPFLLTLSSVFVPLFGVILGGSVGNSYKPAGHADSPKVRWPAAVLWVAGIGLYQGIATLAPQWGATLPTLALTFALAFALQNLRPFTRQSAA
jgi:putative hydroxymethylpyrimidine transporter CytX